MPKESRSEYFREYRKRNKQFSVSIPNEKYDALQQILIKMGQSKTAWLIEKIDEDTKKE